MFKMWILLFMTFVSKSISLDTVIIVRDADCNDPCFRRSVSGKRIINSYIRRSMDCNRLEDCYRMCEYERSFTCEGFNYRAQTTGKSICELTSTPINRVNVHRDFTQDSRCDFYERDWTHHCFHGHDKNRPSSQNWWSNSKPWNPDGQKEYPFIPKDFWPWNTDEQRGYPLIPKDPRLRLPPTRNPLVTQPAPYGGSFNENTQLTIDLSRPIDQGRRPESGQRHDDSWFRPGSNGDRPLPVRPIEDYYPVYDNHRPERPERPTESDFYNYDNRNRAPERPYLPARPGDFNGKNGNRYSYGHPVSDRWQGNYFSKYPQRKFGYGSDPETNEIAPYNPERRKPLKPGHWDSYGPSYADGYHTHYIGDYKPTQFPIAREPLSLPPSPLPLHPPPVSNDHDYPPGPYYNYGGAYGYSNTPALPPKNLPHPSRLCSVRSAGGFRLARGIIRKSYLTPNLEQCQNLCDEQKEFSCLTFAYRYNLAATSPSDNCLLSDIVFENLVFYTDLEPDRDYDIYAMTKNSKWCQVRTKPSNPRRPHPPDECFWRVRSGFSMPPSMIKKPIRVDGMGECQVNCVGSRDFTCRSFVFRYERYSGNGQANCLLSDWPAVEIKPEAMQDMDGAELYERGSFGRGCEPHHPVAHPDPGAHRPVDRRPFRPDDASCYTGFDRPCKLTPYAIIFTLKVGSEAECRRKCSNMRHRDSPPCMSYNYKISSDPQGDNCYLSDVSSRDLRLGLDYTHDNDYILYVWKELESRCSPDDSYDDKQPSYYPLPHSSGHNIHRPIADKPYAKPNDPYYYDIGVPDPIIPTKPTITVLGPAYDIGGYSGGNENNGYHEKFFFSTRPDESSVFRHFTVNGNPCKRGTKCERNRLAGFWTCQPEGSEPDSWEYCCDPGHQCGFSHGYNYPWCYVGPSVDQWRPCSEKYHPYQLNPRPLRPPIINRPLRPRIDNCEYQCRHWPITYLHGEPPPNGTNSVALPNYATDCSSSESDNKYKKILGESKNSSRYRNHTKRREIEPSFSSSTIFLSTSTFSIPLSSSLSSSSSFPSTTPSTTSTSTSLTTLSNKRKRNKINLVPIRIIRNKSNSTHGKYVIRRLKPRLKGSNLVNGSFNYSQRFSRDENTGQYYITKKLSTLSNNTKRAQPTGKVERVIIRDNFIDDNDNDNNKTIESQLVRMLSSEWPNNTHLVTIPTVTVNVINETINLNDTKQWEKVTTIDSPDN
ncbi:uncharacterized protein LOC103572852 [Microplitis demolitor]|uniref:uncharacterized protein LOC103572852 n=1 Tax=Microplitis demolitor TaxID=69319 RepID=UPI00235B6E99|nr:uncharacterized protein LOC103572852 [Microplitis demolitor]